MVILERGNHNLFNYIKYLYDNIFKIMMNIS